MTKPEFEPRRNVDDFIRETEAQRAKEQNKSLSEQIIAYLERAERYITEFKRLDSFRNFAEAEKLLDTSSARLTPKEKSEIEARVAKVSGLIQDKLIETKK